MATRGPSQEKIKSRGWLPSRATTTIRRSAELFEDESGHSVAARALCQTGTVIGSLTGRQIAANVSLCENSECFGGNETRFGDRNHVC